MSKFDNTRDANTWFDHFFMSAARIVSGDHYVFSDGDYRRPYAGREWFKREYNRHALHPAVYTMMIDHRYKPDLWQQLLLEWPHKSQSDPNRLAYTRDERSGEQDRQVVTTIGKYLRRHFSFAPDDMIRDIVAEHTYAGSIKMADDMAEMVNAVINGPRSCMSKDFGIRCDDGVRRHPYAVYDPSLGWGMAVRYDEDGAVLGRCLVWRGDYDNDADYKCFVRSYKREKNETSQSGADEAIEVWLKSKGYIKCSEWPDGTPLMEYRVDSGWLMPYIDGGTQRVDEDTFCIDDNGEIEADETDGTACNGDSTCEHCGRRYNSEDEGIWVGPYEDTHVCGNCEDEFTYVYGRRGNQYYVHNDDAVEVHGESYDVCYLSDNGIVTLHDGEYEHTDNAVWIESVSEYYHCDDDDICYAEDTGEYELKHDCWQCAETNNWYTDNEDYVEIDGETYHPDHAPEVEAEEDEGEQA